MQLTNSIQKHQLLNFSGFLIATYTLFMVAFFFLPNAVDQYKFYTVAVFIPGLFIVKHPLAALKQSALWYLTVLYLAYMLITSLWSADFSGEQLFKDFRLAVYIAVFILVTVYIHIRRATTLDSIITILCISAVVAALISIILWSLGPPHAYSRLIGIGTIENPNPSAFIYGIFAITACYSALHSRTLKQKLVFSAACLVLLVFVILTQSNTGILATFLSVALLLLSYKHDNRMIISIGLASIALVTVFLLASVGMLSKTMDSGFSQRLTIWETVLAQVSEAPLLGNGYQKSTLMDKNGAVSIANYAHNAYLATARDGGLVGLALHVFIFITALRAALAIRKRSDNPVYVILLVYGLVCMLADTDQMITRPREMWIIYWLPLALILAKHASATQLAPAAGTTRFQDMASSEKNSS